MSESARVNQRLPVPKQKKPVFIDQSAYNQKYSIEERVKKPAVPETKAAEVKDILKSLKGASNVPKAGNPLLGKPPLMLTPDYLAAGSANNPMLSSLLTNAIKDTATQLISKFGLGKSLEMLKKKEGLGSPARASPSRQVPTASPENIVPVFDTYLPPNEHNQKRAMSPLKITTTREPKRSKSRRSRSRSTSSTRSGGRHSRHKSSKRDRHRDRRDDGKRRRKRSRTRSRSPLNKSPSLDFNDPMIRKVIKDQYPDLAATLAVSTASSTNNITISDPDSDSTITPMPQMITSNPMMPHPHPGSGHLPVSSGQLPPPPLPMPGQMPAQMSWNNPGYVMYPPTFPGMPPPPNMPGMPPPGMPPPGMPPPGMPPPGMPPLGMPPSTMAHIQGMQFLPPPQIPLPNMPIMQPLPPPLPLPDKLNAKFKKSTLISKTDVSELQCKVCNVKYKTPKPFNDHLESSLHRSRFKTYVEDATKNKKIISFCQGCTIVFEEAEVRLIVITHVLLHF